MTASGVSRLVNGIFFLMAPRPLGSTLFPYTTLFRSQRAVEHHHRLVVRRGGDLQDVEPVDEDRKSTRLNSSHSQISYAVFCLKKKNFELRKRELPADRCLGDRLGELCDELGVDTPAL